MDFVDVSCINLSVVVFWRVSRVGRCHRLFGTPGNLVSPHQISLGNEASPQENLHPPQLKEVLFITLRYGVAIRNFAVMR